MAYRDLAFPEPFVEETVFPPLSDPGTHVKNELTIIVRVHFWAFNSIPLIRVSVLRPVPYCLAYCSFVLSFEIRKRESCNLHR